MPSPVPPSSARALWNLITAMYSNLPPQQHSVFNAWQQVISDDTETAGYSRRHADALVLLTEVMDEVASLPVANQTSFARYIPSWWTALIQPRHSWVDNNGPHVEDANLDMLEALASLVEARSQQTHETAGRKIDILKSATERMIEILKNDSGLESAARSEALKLLESLLEIFNDAPRMGARHAEAAARNVASTLITSSARDPRGAIRLRQLGAALLAALAIASSTTADVKEVAANVRETFGINAQEAKTEDGASSGDPIEQTITVICTQQGQASATSSGPTRELPPAH